MMNSDAPMVSVIMATYNRSNILRYSIGSLLKQSFSNFELIVVDDASTDDTITVVQSFKDDRIKLVCLSTNSGNQAVPNNAGLERARGCYIAYLNQDDLYFPDHLESMLQTGQSGNADWIYAYALYIHDRDYVEIEGIFPGNRPEPFYGAGISASAWMIRAEAARMLGRWKEPRELRIPASQDLVLRGIKAGLKFAVSPRVSILIIPSGNRINSYRDRHHTEHGYYYEQMARGTAFKAEMLLKAYVSQRQRKLSDSVRVSLAFFRLFLAVMKSFSRLTGIPFIRMYYAARFYRKGDFINKLRKIRGLEPL